MTTFLRVVLMTVGFVLVSMPGAEADEISVSELVENSADLAGEKVSVSGELVGDYGNRVDGWTWTQINDDAYVRDPIREGGDPQGANTGIAVRIPTDWMARLGPPGGYRNRGPIVSVTGTWKFHDPERQGESYLEVESLSVIESSRRLDVEVDWTAALAGAILLAAAGVVAQATRPTREQQ